MNPMLTGIVINLKTAVGRREFALENVSRLQVNAIVLNATEAITVAENLNFKFTKSAQACFESHRRSWQYMIENNLDEALVCEDDFFLVRHIDIDVILSRFEKIDWDVIQIGFLQIGLNAKVEVVLKNLQAGIFKRISRGLHRFIPSCSLLKRKRISEGFFTPKGFIYGDFQSGCHAYLISLQGAVRLSSLPVDIMPVDTMLHSLAECNSINSYRSKKSFVAQYSFPSQISDRNH